MTTTVEHCHGNKQSYANVVYCGRPSRWGNPWSINRTCTRELAIRNYADWIDGKLQAPDRRTPPTREDIRRDLKDKRLTCWCKPKLACHCDILAQIANSND